MNIVPTIEQDLAFLKGERHCCADCINRAAMRLGAELARLRGELLAKDRKVLELIELASAAKAHVDDALAMIGSR